MNTTKYYAVCYEGDTQTGTKDSWQLWTNEELQNASDDRRVSETHELINAHQLLQDTAI